MSLKRVSVTAAILLVAGLAWPGPVSAQIYAWRDGSGNLVLSDHPLRATHQRTYSVPDSGIRSTRGVSEAMVALYEPLIVRHSEMNGVRADLVRAVIQTESGYNTYARSRKGALGLMQLMPETAAEYGVLNSFDPAENIRAGVAYLRRLLDRYANREELALAAYNAGPKAVDRYGTIPPYRETKNYVAKITGRTTSTTTRGSTKIYRTVEVIDGREVVRYSNMRPRTR